MSRPKAEEFIPDSQRRPKNRASQLLVIATIFVILIGGALAITRHWYGVCRAGLGFASLIAVMIWSIKNWDIE